MHFHLPIRRRTYIYLGGLTSGLKFVGKVYVVAKQAISGHACSDNSRQNGPSVDSYPHLYEGKNEKKIFFLFREISLVSKRSFMGQRTLQRKIVLFRKKKLFFFHLCLMGNTQKTRRIAHISVLYICIFKIRKYASFIHVYQSMNKKKFSDIIE